MTKTEAERLAAMAHSLRPDWPIPSLMTLIGTHYSKAYRDVAVALSWVACDPTTKTPGRINEQGPWWKATQAGDPTHVVSTTRCPEHPTEAAWNCKPCEQQAAPPPDNWRETYHAAAQRLHDERKAAKR